MRLVAISPDPPATSREFKAKIAKDGKGDVPFALLSDPDSAVIDRYALRDPAYAGEEKNGIPHPAVFVLDAEGRVRWAKIESDYKQRASNEEILAALEKAAAPQAAGSAL